MRNLAQHSIVGEREPPDRPPKPLPEALPLPTVQFRRRAWLEFQRAIDPLAPPRPPRLPRL